MSRPGRRRSAPVIPAERLQPPKLDWSQEIDRRRARLAQDRAEATASPAGLEPADLEPAEAPAAAGGGEGADTEPHPGVRSPDHAPKEPEARPERASDPEVAMEAQPAADPDLAIKTQPTPDADAAIETQPATEPDAATETEPTPNPDAAIETEPTPNPDAAIETQPSPEPDAVIETQPDPDLAIETEPATEPDAATETEPTPDPDLAIETEPVLDPDAAIETQPAPDADADAAIESQPTPEPDLASETQPAPDLEAAIESQPTAEPDAAIETAPAAEARAATQHPADAGGRGTTEGPPAELGPSDVAAALPPPVPAPRAHRAAAAPRPSSSAPPRAPRHSVRGPVGGPPRRQAIIAVAALLAVTCTTLVLLNVLRSQQTGAEAARPAVTSSPPALAATGTPAAETPSVTVLGGEGANDAESVPPVEALRTGLHGAAVQVSAAEGVRYVKGAAGSSGTFAALVRSVPAGSRLVALVGGGNDRSAALLPLATAVNQTIRAVQQRAPRAEIVVVGPLSPGRASPPSGVLQVRATLRAAAASTARVHFVDPIAGHWLASPSTVTPGGRLTEAGKQELARRLAGALAPYVR